MSPTSTITVPVISDGSGHRLCLGLPVAGLRSLIAAPTAALDISNVRRKRHVVPIGSTFQVDLGGVSATATVARSSYDKRVSALAVDQDLTERLQLVAHDFERHDLVDAWDGTDLTQFEVLVAWEVGDFKIRRVDSRANPELVTSFIGSPIWKSGNLIGMIESHIKGATYNAVRVDQIRRGMPAQSRAKGSPVYQVERELGDRLADLQAKLREQNRPGITSMSGTAVEQAYEALRVSFHTYVERDEFGRWLAEHANETKKTFISWNAVSKGPQGEAGRSSLASRFQGQRMSLFNELYLLEPETFAATIHNSRTADAAIFDAAEVEPYGND